MFHSIVSVAKEEYPDTGSQLGVLEYLILNYAPFWVPINPFLLVAKHRPVSPISAQRYPSRGLARRIFSLNYCTKFG